MGQDNDIARRDMILAAAMAGFTAVGAQAAPAPRTPGKPGDFDFLAGNWKISHRKLKKPGSNEWDLFPGEATCWTILGGVGSVEELRIPARRFHGMGLRLLDVEKRVWSDYWIPRQQRSIDASGHDGSFENGSGIFISDDEEDGRKIQVRALGTASRQNHAAGIRRCRTMAARLGKRCGSWIGSACRGARH